MSQTSPTSVRNPAIELYRVMLMFGICFLHANTQGGHYSPRISAILLPCVNGFVFISGWFGISFSFKRLRKLVANALYAGGMAILLTWLFMPEQLSFTKECLEEICCVVIGQWFFLAYVVLTLVAPAINYIVDHLDRELAKKVLIPVAVLMMWNWCKELLVVWHLRYPDGFGSYTPLALILTYMVARIIRRFDLFSCLKKTYVVAGILALVALFFTFPSCNLSVYASPLAIAFAGLLFYACSQLQINNKVFVRLVTLIAPSMFIVYLIHSHKFGFMAMARFEDWMLSQGGLCYFATATLVFLIGVVSDIPRRALTGRISFLCSSDRRMVLR